MPTNSSAPVAAENERYIWFTNSKTSTGMHDLPHNVHIQSHVQKRNLNMAIIDSDARYEDPSIATLPSFDKNAWYYPSHGDANDDVRFTSVMGNWGRKSIHDARWIRKGKLAAWGPGLEDWEIEERARKRIRLLVSQEPEHSPPATIPYLRSPSPPLMAPYPTPSAQHLSYTSFVMDKAVTSSFRSRLLDELESATNNLIEGEASMRRALGRLWQAMSEDPEQTPGEAPVVPKREDEGDEEEERERRLAHIPDLTPVVHKLFLSIPDSTTPTYDDGHMAHPDIQLENLEKSLATLRELQDDGREYVERLEEIRDGLGNVRTQRNGVWDLVRKKAIKELQGVASNCASAL
ncbi:uncharacterized protein FIBRA_03705 [Fibroporia radiculosa]|uniref:Transcriptional regulatory protein RXT2 N-terminal domain-containing protein n=1 Tax=Fibroporia radiculosa TaxID=599839 RepID=J4H2J7_9APHY|nr:uncharacterized protein FIBRA_03705 [Fibroporia radiculosa]CCM01644.1 predicted protein [Fibroporia radiculosa]